MITLGTNIIRFDTKGSGEFGASRIRYRDGNKYKVSHKGVDLLCLPNLPIYAEQDMEFIRIKNPYSGMSGGLWRCGEYEVTVFYCEPIEENVQRGGVIGTCQNVATKYGKEMMPHIHTEIDRDWETYRYKGF